MSSTVVVQAVSNDERWSEEDLGQIHGGAEFHTRRRQASIEELAVLDLPSPDDSDIDNPLNKWTGLTTFFRPETCARHLVVTTFDRISEIPAEVLSYADACGRGSYLGESAYSYLLEVCCGLRSDAAGEYEVSGQIRKKWQEFLDTEKQRETRTLSLERIMGWIFEDSKAIRTKILKHVTPVNAEYSAKQLAAIRGGESVLIASSDAAHCTAMARTLGRCSSSSVGEMWIWYKADTTKRSQLMQRLQKHYRKKEIKCCFDLTDERDVPELVKDIVSHVFISGMSKDVRNSQMGELIVPAWLSRERSKSDRLVVVETDLRCDTVTPLGATWQQAADAGLIESKEVIENWTNLARDRLSLLSDAKESVARIASLRGQGISDHEFLNGAIQGTDPRIAAGLMQRIGE